MVKKQLGQKVYQVRYFLWHFEQFLFSRFAEKILKSGRRHKKVNSSENSTSINVAPIESENGENGNS